MNIKWKPFYNKVYELIVMMWTLLVFTCFVMVLRFKESMYCTRLLNGLSNLRSGCALSGWDSITTTTKQQQNKVHITTVFLNENSLFQQGCASVASPGNLLSPLGDQEIFFAPNLYSECLDFKSLEILGTKHCFSLSTALFKYLLLSNVCWFAFGKNYHGNPPMIFEVKAEIMKGKNNIISLTTMLLKYNSHVANKPIGTAN